ncbi:MAG: class I SAM-dependent methyltransferase [Acidobacteria bacterium]|nr:class I SAM-dependent methyltransferase [Acidobacteriota bacterium]
MSNFDRLARRNAELKFGKDNEAAIEKWVGYWTDTLSRNLGLVESFRTRIKIDFRGKTVLDLGCGTGGLSKMVTDEGGFYIGSDYFPAILEMAYAFISDLPNPNHASLIRASGTDLPLADGSVDVVVTFDVIEHLEGGESWQQSFLKEIRRVLRPKGVLLLVTPNRLYPFEGHTFLYGPQFMPVWLADRYIRWKNPSFLQEYKTYAQVKLLHPWTMKRLLDRAKLKIIHDFPCGLDWDDYPRRTRLMLWLLGKIGLGWALTSAFWFSAGREEDWDYLTTLKKKERWGVMLRI